MIAVGGSALRPQLLTPRFELHTSYDVSRASRRSVRVDMAPQREEEVCFGVKIKDLANSDHLLICFSSSRGS